MAAYIQAPKYGGMVFTPQTVQGGGKPTQGDWILATDKLTESSSEGKDIIPFYIIYR